ncbi:DUF2087 domain-containing protein [Chitinimonas lacunae]|uniref:DUF2087 domain-containing protein n=1 Tax=Chitinimonas lacunae TaxID=1963018 RepID=A0ABV8MQY4_9NEIS
MSRLAIPFHSDDISALARSLCQQLEQLGQLPGHLQMLNMLARASGHRNFQSLRAAPLERPAPVGSLPAPAPAPIAATPKPTPSLSRQLERYFDAEGRLLRWPSKFSHQEPCLWVLWSRLPARRTFNEAEVNGLIKPQHHFGDHVLLRRELCNYGLLSRTLDGRIYHRVERQPTAEMLQLIRTMAARMEAVKQS